MKPMPFLTGLALVFWGWQTGYLAAGIALGAVMEGPRWWGLRVELGAREVRRIGGLVVIVLVAVALLAFVGTEAAQATGELLKRGYNPDGIEGYKKMTRALLVFVQWLPVALLPLAAARSYSAAGGLDLAPWLDRLPSLREEWAARSISDRLWLGSDYPYIAACVLGASAASRPDSGFLFSLCLLVGYALWPIKPPGYGRWAWIVCLSVALGLGWVGQFSARQIREVVQRLNQALAERFTRYLPDSDEARTSIGSVGRLKQSGRIIYRVEPDRGPPPVYLRESTFNLFRGSIWFRTGAGLEALPSEEPGSTWRLVRGGRAARQVTLSRHVNAARSPIAAPLAAVELQSLNAGSVLTNRLGSIIARETPGFVRYEVGYGPGGTLDGPPDADDLVVPDNEQRFLIAAMGQLAPGTAGGVEAVERVSRFFADHFSYTLALTTRHRATAERTALGTFLLEVRAGHCEYFATATVLLLRQLGIPARYATGYAVDERQGAIYVARERHAHAWCLAWVNGSWQEVDTTPSSWHAVEDERAPPWEPFLDRLSGAWYAFTRWRAEGGSIRSYLLVGSLSILGILAVRLLLRGGITRAKSAARVEPRLGPRAGMDSEFLGLMQRFGDRGLGPRSEEPPLAWARRIGPSMETAGATLEEAALLHERLRFDPLGLTPGERARLRAVVDVVEVAEDRRNA